MIFYKKKSNLPTVPHSEAVDEALCFCWIDSKAKPVEKDTFIQFSADEKVIMFVQKRIRKRLSD